MQNALKGHLNERKIGKKRRFLKKMVNFVVHKNMIF